MPMKKIYDDIFDMAPLATDGTFVSILLPDVNNIAGILKMGLIREGKIHIAYGTVSILKKT